MQSDPADDLREPGSEIAVLLPVRKLGRQSGFGKLHPHMLRHTYGTRFCLQGLCSQ